MKLSVEPNPLQSAACVWDLHRNQPAVYGTVMYTWRASVYSQHLMPISSVTFIDICMQPKPMCQVAPVFCTCHQGTVQCNSKKRNNTIEQDAQHAVTESCERNAAKAMCIANTKRQTCDKCGCLIVTPCNSNVLAIHKAVVIII